MPRRPHTLRRAAIVLVAALAAPSTWLRTPVVDDFRPILHISSVAAETRRIGAFTIEGLWQLRSQNEHFGGYSALLTLPGGRLLAVSDRGRYLRFAPPGAPPFMPEYGAIEGISAADKRAVDAEAVTADAARKTVWIAYEGRNAIARFAPDLARGTMVAPRAMRRWSSNSGPESIARLGDGRFLVLEEGRMGTRPDHQGLLFSGDPVTGAEPLTFRYIPPAGFRPVDAAALPDGRVLILHRRVTLGLPYAFESAISLADPRTIRRGAPWHGRVIATIAAPLPTDNFEGLAVKPRDDGALTVWLISDDNGAAFQRTLLYELTLDLRDVAEADKRRGARIAPHAPS